MFYQGRGNDTIPPDKGSARVVYNNMLGGERLGGITRRGVWGNIPWGYTVTLWGYIIIIIHYGVGGVEICLLHHTVL